MKKMNLEIKNILAKRAVILLSLLSLLALTGCSNLNESEKSSGVASGKTSEKTSEKTCLVTGIVTSSLSRSATTYFSLKNCEFSVYALSIENSYRVDGTCNIDEDKMTYTLKLPFVGAWSVYVVAQCEHNGELTGIAEVSVDEDYSPINVPLISLKPQYDSVLGSISLDINDKTSDKILDSVAFKGVILSTESGNGDNSLENLKTVKFENGVAQIKLSDIVSNLYEVQFSFYDAEGNILYRCKEAVAVFGGFETNSWYGEGAYIAYDEETQKYSFNITDSLVINYGTELVPSTDYILYDYNNNTYSYSYKGSDKTASTDTVIKAGSELVSANSSKFAFDSQGAVYAFNAIDTYAEMKTSRRADAAFRVDCIEMNSASGITVDTKNDVLYTYFSEYDEPTIADIFKYESFISGELYNSEDYANADSIVPSIHYKVDSSMIFSDSSLGINTEFGSLCHEKFIVHDGIGYDLFTFAEESYPYARISALVKIDFSKASEENNNKITSEENDVISYIKFKELLNLENDEKLEGFDIKDMIYHDGDIYILVNQNFISFGPEPGAMFANRGAVIKVSLFNGFTSRIGWVEKNNGATEFEFSSSIENQKYHIFAEGTVQSSNDIIPEVLYEPDATEPAVLTSAEIYQKMGGTSDSIKRYAYVPFQNSDNKIEGFCGPQAFIAIKPKKLVIADSGIAFYTDSDGVWNYKNVNRIVMVDLESFAIEEYKDVDVAFNSPETDNMIIRGSAWSVSYTNPGTGTYLIWSGEGSSYAGNEVFVGFMNPEEM